MRVKDETLREALLAAAKKIAGEKGTEAVNIRAIARETNIAPGTVYNYFTGKSEILLALTEEYWRSTLKEMEEEIREESFADKLLEIYQFLKVRIFQSAGVLMGSLGGAADDGRMKMRSMQDVMQKMIFQYMEEDKSIREDIWSGPFTKEAFAGFVTMNLIGLLGMKEPDPEFFFELVRRTLY